MKEYGFKPDVKVERGKNAAKNRSFIENYKECFYLIRIETLS